MQLLRRNSDLILILVVGFVLRFTISFLHSYTNDELSAINRLRYDSLTELIGSGVKAGDMHPAGVQVFMKAWTSAFGTSEVALRFPFVLCGVFSIFVLYVIGLKWFNRRTGIFAAALLSVLYFPIVQAELARPYSPGLLIALLTAWFYHKVLFCEVKKYKNAVLLGLCFAAAMYTHYFLFLIAGWMGITGLFFLNRENIRLYLLAAAIAVVLFIPHIPVTMHHLSVGGLGWLGPPESSFLFQFLFYAFNESWIFIAGLLVLILLSFFSSAPTDVFRSKYFVLIVAWFFGAYLLGHLLSLISTPVLKFPVMLFVLPFLFLMLGVLVSRSGWYRLSVALAFAGGIASTLFEKDLYGERHMGYRETARHLVEWDRLYGREHIYTVYNLSNPDYMNFYAQQFGDSIDFDRSVIEFSDDYAIRRELLTRTEPYCVVGYSERLTLPNVFETVREFYPHVVTYYRYDNSAVFLMTKGEGQRIPRMKKILSADLAASGGDVVVADTTYDAVPPVYISDSGQVYGPDILFYSTEIRHFDRAYLRVNVYASCPPGAQLTVSLSAMRNGEQLQYRGENFWIGHDLEEMLQTTHDPDSGMGVAYFAFEIPEFIRESDELKISLWNRNGMRIEIYGMEVWEVENIWSADY